MVETSGRGATWRAKVTPEGQAHLDLLTSPQAPRLRQPNGSRTQEFVDDLIAAGGSLAFEQPHWYQVGEGSGVDFVERARAAHRHRRVPPGCWLSISRTSSTEYSVELRYPPDGWPTIDGPVPLPRGPSQHPVVRQLKEQTAQHEWTRAAIPRVMRVVHAVVAEAERRGFVVVAVPGGARPRDWSGPKDGHLRLEGPHGSHSLLRVSEEGLSSRSYWEYRDRSRSWGEPPKSEATRRAEYEQEATGRLILEFVPRGYREIRVTRWADNSKRSLEGQLPELLFELGIREIDAAEANEHARLEELSRRDRWEAAIAGARAELETSKRRELLEQQVARWQEADRIRRYCDAAMILHADDSDAVAWVAWAQQRADDIDPLRHSRLRGPDLSVPPSPDDLRPFLKGWSPHGPDASY